MSWSYTPVVTEKDQVRLLIGDTDSEDPQLQDEEIAFLLIDSGNSVRDTALRALDTLAAKWARVASYAIDDISEQASDKAVAYRQAAQVLREGGLTAGLRPVPGAVGISKSEKWAADVDSDRNAPAIRIGIHDQGTGGDPTYLSPA